MDRELQRKVEAERIAQQIADAELVRDDAQERGDELCVKVVSAWLKELRSYALMYDDEYMKYVQKHFERIMKPLNDKREQEWADLFNNAFKPPK